MIRGAFSFIFLTGLPLIARSTQKIRCRLGPFKTVFLYPPVPETVLGPNRPANRLCPYPWKISSGKNADTVTLGKSTTLLILRSTATLQMT